MASGWIKKHRAWDEHPAMKSARSLDKENAARPAWQRRPARCFVYCISETEDGRVGIYSKIGIAADPSKRLRDLQVGNPRRLVLSASWPFRDRQEAENAEKVAQQNLPRCLSHGGPWVEGEWVAGDVTEIIRAVDVICRHLPREWKATTQPIPLSVERWDAMFEAELQAEAIQGTGLLAGSVG